MNDLTLPNMALPSYSTSHVIQSQMTEDLSRIYEESLNLVVLKRALSSDLTQAVASLIHQSKHLKLSIRVTPSTAMTTLKKELGGDPFLNPLCRDVAYLVDMFCYLFALEQIGLRMTVLDRAMCPKFHVDRVPCRLITTYSGVGTEWLDNDSVDRLKLGSNSLGLSDEESGVVRQLGQIERLEPGDLGLLKGESWEGNEGNGIVHRSPQVAPNEDRLIMTLDFAF